MSYREFWQPEDKVVVDYSPIERGMTNLFQTLATQQANRRKAADQFSYDLNEGKYENDQQILTEMANNVVSRARSEFMGQNRVSNETRALMNQGKKLQQDSAIQFERAKQLNQQISDRDAKDPYYDGQIDQQKLRTAVNGENNDVNFYTRGERLNEFERGMNGIDSFKFANYRADYIKGIGNQYKEKTTGNKNSSKTIYDQATFWDNGKPGVSDQAAVDFINSDTQGRVEKYYNKRMDDTLSQEISSMKASGDPRVSWMKGMNDTDIKNELINNPSRNIINSQDYGVRKREMVKKDLSDGDRINSKVSVEYKADKNGSNGMYNNDNIVHSYSFNQSKIMAAVPGNAFSPNPNNGPGGVIMQKSGKPISFSSANPVRTDVNTGRTNRIKIGNVPFNLTGYQVQAFKSTGSPISIKGDNTDEMVAYINALPYETWNPEGPYRAKPQMSIAFSGFTVNQANVLNAANNQEQSLQEQINQAQANGDQDKVANLEMQLNKIQGVRSLIQSGVDDQELALAASRSGIRGVQVNELVEATPSDIANVKAITQGLDLSDRKYWNEDMTKVADAWAKRAQEAQAAGYKSTPIKTSKKKAKFPLPKGQPESVTQDGYTFTWNADTGQYE